MANRLTLRVIFFAFGTLLVAWASVGARAEVKFASTEAAFRQGFSAYKSRQYEIAVPALKFAASKGVIRAQFYLAKIYSDNGGDWTNHGMAYRLLSRIVDGYANVDPKDYRVAPYVAQALTSIARYERDGIKAIQLRPSTKRALVFFDHAASYFSDEDAQFELAKHYLAGDGVKAQVPYALNWLARLSKRGHAGAQAFLANLYRSGRYTIKDPVRALALVTVAVENASEEDRFWIEDLHQSIFCEARQDTRARVHQVVGRWRQRFGRTHDASVVRDELDSLSGQTQRLCSNGDVVGDLKPQNKVAGTLNAAAAASATAPPPVFLPGAMLGGSRAPQSGSNVSGSPQNPATASGPSKMSRAKPERHKNLRALNGFAVRSVDNGDDGEARREPVDRRSLNGFVLKGGSTGTSFGFSLSPRSRD